MRRILGKDPGRKRPIPTRGGSALRQNRPHSLFEGHPKG